MLNFVSHKGVDKCGILSVSLQIVSHKKKKKLSIARFHSHEHGFHSEDRCVLGEITFL